MKNLTIVTTPSANNEIYELLNNPLSGESTCLSGACECINKHAQIDGMLEFCLTDEQALYLQENYNVDVIDDSQTIPELEAFTITDIAKGQYKTQLAGFNPPAGSNTISHHIYHCQHIDVDKSDTSDVYTNVQKLSTIDCSNVDVLVIDTGIDITHPDVGDQVVQFDWALLRDGADGTTGTQIISQINDSSGNPFTQVPADYYKDRNGHGTACASLIAGKRSGFAKNAKLYALRWLDGYSDEGFQNENVILQLALAFLKAKKNNLLGLDSSRPTVLSNSWGSVSYTVHQKDLPSSVLKGRIPTHTKNIQRYHKKGTGVRVSDHFAGISAEAYNINRYIREIVSMGGHFIASSGNSNSLKDPTALAPHIAAQYLDYPRTGTPRVLAFAYTNTVANIAMTKELRENFTYRDALTSTDFTVTGYDNVDYTFSFYGEYPVSIGMSDTGPPITVSKPGSVDRSFGNLPEYGSSPDVGWRSRMIQDNLSNVNSVEYNAGYRHVSSTLYDNLYSVPDSEIVSINVGCVSPVCDPFESLHEGVNSAGDYYPYWTGCNSNLTHNFLSGMSTDSANNFLFDSRRFNALSEVSYVKTSYSEFGPGVDVYAPGNGTLAAITNFKSSLFRPPNTTVSSNEKYGFFNGTSAACPVAAGCLATFLADNPTASPKAAKQWLIDASLKNSILETSFETHDDNPTDDIFDCDEWRRHDSIPMATKVSNPELLDALYYSTAYGPADMAMNALSEEKRRLAMLHNHRFFKSHNRVVQAYPLRKAIVKQFTDPPLTNITIGSTLTLSGGINPDDNTFITHLSADRF